MNRWVMGCSAVVLVAAFADLFVAIRPSRPFVSLEAMKAARTQLAELTEPSDVVVHSPLFTVEELAGIGAMQARPDRPKAVVRRRRRAVVLDFADAPMFGLGAFDREIPLGQGLVIRTYPPLGGPSGAVWSLAEQIEPTTMLVERNGRRRSCRQRRQEGGYRCAGEPEWLNASVRALRVGGEERECVWAHPTTGGAIIFNVPVQPPPAPGRRLKLKLQAGLTDEAVRLTPDGASVTTTVVTGKPPRRLGKLMVANRVGWFERTFDLTPAQPVELRITSPRDGRRHHCINAQIVEVP
ncbi:MAG: hypothetical protein AAFN74_02945 [Myxococcota bacterium]